MKPNGRKKLNIFLAVLLVFAAVVLAVVGCARSNGEAVSPGNYIRNQTGTQDTWVLSSKTTRTSPAGQAAQPTQQASIEIFRSTPSEQLPFSAENMLPGDSTAKTYTIHVSHKGGVTLYFSAAVQSGSDAVLAQGLCISVACRGDTIYDGPFSTLPDSMACTLPAASADTCEAVPYAIQVYLPTSAGNEYQNKRLSADFRWWVTDDGNGSTPGSNLTPWVVDDNGRPDIPKTIASVIARTGGSFWIRLLFMLFLVALVVVVMYFLLRGKEDPHERK